MPRKSIEHEVMLLHKQLAKLSALHRGVCEFLANNESMTLPDYLRLCRKTKAVTGFAGLQDALRGKSD